MRKNTFRVLLGIFYAFWFPILVYAGTCNTNSGSFVRASSQHSDVSSNLGITGGNITIMLWFNLASLGNAMTMAVTGNATNFVLYSADFNWTVANDLSCKRGKQNVANQFAEWSPSPALATGNWYFMACTYDGTNITSYFTSTSTIGQYSQSAASGNGASAQPDKSAVGATYDAAVTRFFDGQVDDVRIYNTVRTASQMQTDFNTEVSCASAGLVAYWKMDGDWTDCTSNAFNLTAVNSPTFSTSVPFAGICASFAPWKLEEF